MDNSNGGFKSGMMDVSVPGMLLLVDVMRNV
jgi:hypothetical protein